MESDKYIELYDDSVFPSDLQRHSGNYVTTVLLSTTDKRECMKIAASYEMQSGDPRYLMSPHRFMLQCYHIGESQGATVADFVAAATRAEVCGAAKIGPRVLKYWTGVYTATTPRAVFGFVLMVKPDCTLAEYTTMYYRTDFKWLETSIIKSSNVLKELVERISHARICWPGHMITPFTVGIALREDDPTSPLYAVVMDWSSCLLGAASTTKVMSYLIDSLSEFLRDLDSPSIMERLKNFQEIFQRAVESQRDSKYI